MYDKFVIGIDFGTDSVRTLIVNAEDGEEIATSVAEYKLWSEGRYCEPLKSQFRQHPQDYIDALKESITSALNKTPKNIRKNIKGFSIDTTGSTPVAVNKEGIPLSLLDEFKEDPDAMFILWKDHTAVREAEEINYLAKNWEGEDYTKYEGGVYSSEWFFSKILHVFRKNERVRENAFSWVEHCDWMPAFLTGNVNPLEIKRSRCAAGHKAMWHSDWNGLPSEDFLIKLDESLKGLRKRLYTQTYTVDVPVGNLSSEWAKILGLNEDITIGVGAFDAHIGAIGAEIKPKVLTKVMGTSTCDMLVVPYKEVKGKLIKGICGQVDGSIIPEMIGMEAGQSAFGDIYAWFRRVLLWPVENFLNDEKQKKEIYEKILPELSKQAEKLDLETNSELAVDWMNGRRTPFANQKLKGVIANLNLGSDAVRIFKALVESTGFGAKRIIDRFREEGIEINEVSALGGVAKKSDFIMQTVTDILDLNIKVVKSEQTCALGAAMCAATVSGIYPSIQVAQERMGQGFEKEYKPQKERVEKYKKIYDKYIKLGDFIENNLTE